MTTTCDERVDRHRESRMADLKALYRFGDCDPEERRAFCEEEGIDLDSDGGREAADERRCEYGLCFDYVAPGTFTDDQKTPCFDIGADAGYWRYQISWGGPSEEIRFFASGGTFGRAEFWLLDWFDGASTVLAGSDRETALAMWAWFADTGSIDHAYTEALR